jgi:hypothetical protein
LTFTYKDAKNDIFTLLQQNFDHFNIETKLVGQTYAHDGAAVMAGELNGLQKKIKSIAPQALFIYCYAHKLNLVLQDSCKQIRECRIFFSNVSGFSAFFTKSTKRTNSWIQFVKKNYLPNNSETRWNSKSRVVNTLFDKKKTNSIEVFDHIIENLDQWVVNPYRNVISIWESIVLQMLKNAEKCIN